MVSLQTDGLQWVTVNRGSLFEPFYRAVYELISTADSADVASCELTEQLSSPKVRTKCDDDLSLAVAVHGVFVSESMDCQ
jgi:hypothetical protein